MALLFSKVLEKAARKNNNLKYGSVELRDFLRDKALRSMAIFNSPKKMINTSKAKSNTVTQIKPGEMICYFYDAKHKATLPYWDKFPVIFPIEIYKDGFLGINLHYLPPVYRARLMDALYDTLNNKKYNENTRLKATYALLNNAAKYKYFKPCIKRYLSSHIQSRIVRIDAKEWDYAMMMPLARFQKASQRKVWDDSINSINS